MKSAAIAFVNSFNLVCTICGVFNSSVSYAHPPACRIDQALKGYIYMPYRYKFQSSGGGGGGWGGGGVNHHHLIP